MGDIVPINGRPAEFVRPPDLPFTCSDEQLLEAVAFWLLGEEKREVAKKLGIPTTAVKHWARAPGWKYLEDCVRGEAQRIAGSALTRLTNQVISKLEERVEHGDPVYDMNGQQIGTRPVKARDLAVIYANLVDRQKLLQQRAEEKEDDTLIDLRELALGLKRYAQAKEITAESAQ